MSQRLNQFILLGAIGGLLLGIGLRNLHQQHSAVVYTLHAANLIGLVFISMLKMIIIPLVFCAIAVGIARLNGQHEMQKLWRYTLVFFVASMLVAIVLALLSTGYFKPGAGLHLGLFADVIKNQQQVVHQSVFEFILDMLRGILINPFSAFAGGNVLATIFIAFIVGIALIASDERLSTIRRLLDEGLELTLRIVGWVMHLAPLGIAALLTKLALTQDVALLFTLLKFIAVVVGTTLLHGVVVLPLALFLITRRSPWWFWIGAKDALITAAATSSSAATIPVTLRCVTSRLGVRPAVGGFVVPLGATLNMDGTALYEAAAALFVANLVGMELGLTQQIVVVAVSMLAAVGAPGIPSAGMVTMIMVLQAVGLPAEAIGILLPMDRILDTIRTAVNVEGDMVGSIVVQHWLDKRTSSASEPHTVV